MWELMPLRSAAWRRSGRSLRPRSEAWAGPKNGVRAAVALVTASVREPPSVQPTQFRRVLVASLRTGLGRSASLALTTYFARIRVTSFGGVVSAAAAAGGTAKAAEAPRKRRRSSFI